MPSFSAGATSVGKNSPFFGFHGVASAALFFGSTFEGPALYDV